ncbi:hypothetical protein M407DRAFT_243297 [Tulasnella calospora MUT 4182]|uniref:Uncharacterized protein n=1 Tax=Tulasnella calospora MUT 4182 TaxID=1051891 RepID=A0A0C3QLT7_9AGAM|nr:hypothetical protein M407DRAFT_243297 [Tulasnella calospora MUT 4182]
MRSYEGHVMDSVTPTSARQSVGARDQLDLTQLIPPSTARWRLMSHIITCWEILWRLVVIS